MKKIYFLLALALLTRFSAMAQPNDLCTGAITLSCGQTITGTTVGSTIDAVGTCVTTLGTAPGIWYSFIGDGLISTISLCGSSYDTKVAAFSGTCAALVCITGNDDFCGLQSQIGFPTTLGVQYYILVTGFGAATGNFTMTRTCSAPPTNDLCTGAININCAQTVTGTTVGASTDAVGTCTTPLNTSPGVWYSMVGDGLVNTLSLCGSGYDTKVGVFTGTCAGLVCVVGNDDFCGLQSQVSFTATLGTQYYIIVTGFGAATGNFTMTRTCAPPNPNDLCSGAINIDCAQTITGNTSTATIDAVPTCITPLNTAPGLWYTFTGNGATITLSTCGSGYDTKIGVFSGSCAALTCVTGNDDFCGLQSQVNFPSVFGTQYYVLITGFGSGSGNFTLTRTCTFPNEVCSGSIPIACGQTINGTTAGAALDAVGTCVTSLGTAPGVWYSFTGDGSSVVLSLCGGISNYDTKLGVFTGTCGALTCVTGNDDFCGLQSQVTFNTVFGNQYYILVTGFSTNAGNYSLTRTCVAPCTGTPTAGTITGPPAVCSTSTGTLTLSGFTGLPGISIQWKSSTTAGGPYTNIPGATGSSYNFPASSTTTYYIATVSCAGGGSANTPEFTLTRSLPVHSAVSATVTTVCSPGAATVTGTVSGGVLTVPSVYGTSGTINLAIPDNTPAGVNSTIAIPSFNNFPAAADLKVRINARHSWVGDVKFTLTSPCGVTFLFDRPGFNGTGFGNSDNLGTSNAATPPPAVYTFDLSAATVIPEAASGPGFIPGGSYIPSDAAGVAHNWAGITFPCGSGNWVLNIADNAGGDTGALIDWQILGPPLYSHTLTGGPGTITQNAPTGAGNSTANFSLTNVPFGTHTYTLTSTDAIGCSVSSNVTIVVKQTPTISFTQNPVNPICNGTIQTITANVNPSLPQTFTQIATTTIPAGSPGVSGGPAGPYPSTVVASGLPTSGPTVRSVKLGNINHSFPDDIDVVLVSPGGVSVILMSDVGGGSAVAGADYILDDAAATALADATLNAPGTYKPTNYGVPDTWVAPGPGSLSQATPTLSSFGAGNHNGTWSLYIVDDATGDVGYIGNWSITFNIPTLVTFSPVTNLWLNAAATIPYTGTPVSVVYANPSVTTTYTANTTVDGCPGSNTVTVTVNQLPAITTQPLPATQTICAGFNVTYTVVATGTGLTYQWRRNGVNLVDNAQISGSTTNTLTITGVTTANAGTYTVVVSGACPPAVTSANAVLNVATTPVISAQPANQTVCVGQNAIFTVGTTGSVPPPTIFQWQVSTDGGTTWTNLTTGGSFTATFTLVGAALTDNGKRFRVIITNFCGQTVTSNSALLTVNANTVVTAGILPRICISDTLVPLVGTPVGGSWSGIGVSGFNFVPSATAVGTYTLTYSFTNAAGCTSTATTIAKVEDCQERIRLLSKDGLILFPNPNNGRFNIKMNSTLYPYLGMRVYTTGGQLVRIQSWNGLVYGRVVPIDLTNLPSGTYMVKFYYDDGARTSEKTFPVIIGRE